MVLSEYDRRWAEIRFYQFCADTYKMRNKSIDIITYAEAICEMGSANKRTIRNIIRVMLNDTYYQSTKRDIIILGRMKGLSVLELSKYLGMSRPGVDKYAKANTKTYTPIPRCGIDEDHEIVKFLETLDKVAQIGNLGNGTIN